MAIGIILIAIVVAFIIWSALRNTPEYKGKEGELHVHNIPATLIGMLFNRFMHWSSGYETTVDFYK